MQHISAQEDYRIEHDLLGEKEVPNAAYYGIQTMRALENFPITGVPLAHHPSFIRAFAQVKFAAAEANKELGLVEEKIAEAIKQACRNIIDDQLHDQFVVDMIQGGAGTSTNMNANEVIANHALELLGREKGEYEFCHPNNHVNCSQSTNDAYPSALKIAIIQSNIALTEELDGLIQAFRSKAEEFKDVIKMGRTQLQDAVPITLGQEFEAYSVTLEEEIERLGQTAELFLELNMGGTAVGTGINTKSGYRRIVIEQLRAITGFPVTRALNLVESTQDTGAFIMYSSALKRLSVKLSKICNDLRLLSSGPRTGLNEINLPKVQPGSSIMPGKVNPVIPEVMNQITYKVIGNDLTVTLAAEAGQLQLNVMFPVIAQSLGESIEMLIKGMSILKSRCIEGITANKDRCRELVENSIGLVTVLVPELGYEVCSNLARQALVENKGIYELVLEKELLSQENLNSFLSLESMVGPLID
ncbi:MAG: aspartate ammonia-lyase [Deltaproteobacteria bacterium]|nr:aspartate ammonia-lyase [Deltaproteobacteria bacterium]